MSGALGAQVSGKRARIGAARIGSLSIVSQQTPAAREDLAVHGSGTHKVVTGTRDRAAETGEIAHAGNLAGGVVLGAQAIVDRFARSGEREPRGREVIEAD